MVVASSGLRVGLSCGFTLYHTIHHLKEHRFRDLTLYPLSGESTLRLVDLSPNTLVGMMAAKYRPHVAAYALPVQHLPACVRLSQPSSTSRLLATQRQSAGSSSHRHRMTSCRFPTPTSHRTLR